MTTPEGEGAQSGAEGTQSGAGSTSGNEHGTGTTGETSGAQSGTETAQTGNSEVERLAAQLEAQRARTQAADKRAAEHEAALKQLRDKDLPEQQKLTRDLQEAQKTVETLTATNNALAVRVAFLEDNTYSWQNPKRAMQLLDMSNVEIQPDGTVSGLKDALKALATSDPYLLKAEAAGQETPPATPGGTAPGNNGNTGGTKPDTKKMASRIPALRTRVPRS